MAVTAPHPHIIESLVHLAEPIDSVHLYPDNARHGDLESIKRSLTRLRQFKAIVANRRTNDILAGNHVWTAASDLGWSEIAVTWVDVDEDTAREMVLVDNRTAELGGFNEEDLAALLALVDGESLGEIGYAPIDVEALLAGSVEEPADRGYAPPPPPATVAPRPPQPIAAPVAVEDDDGEDFKPFSAYEEFVVDGVTPGRHGKGTVSEADGEWVVLRVADIRLKVKRSGYARIYDAALREARGDRQAALEIFGRSCGFADDEMDAKLRV